jgi:Peptidase inhibitor I78 family
MHARTLFLSALLMAGALAVGCGTVDSIGTPPSSVPAPETSPPGGASCDAAKAQSVIGRLPSNDLLERARAAAQAGSARFLRHNEPITMEFLGSRLNLVLNERGVVHATYCG